MSGPALLDDARPGPGGVARAAASQAAGGICTRRHAHVRAAAPPPPPPPPPPSPCPPGPLWDRAGACDGGGGPIACGVAGAGQLASSVSGGGSLARGRARPPDQNKPPAPPRRPAIPQEFVPPACRPRATAARVTAA